MDCGITPHGTVDRTSASSVEVKSPVRDAVVTSHDFPSPVRNVRPTRLDLTAMSTPKVDSPDDRKPLTGILLNRSPRRTNALLGFVISHPVKAISISPYFTERSFLQLYLLQMSVI